MNEIDERILGQMVKALVRDIDPERIVLFGSRARGDARADSDVDLLVVEREPFGPGRSRWRELARIRRALTRFPFPKDVLVYSADEVARWRAATNHVIARSLRDGRTLYERP